MYLEAKETARLYKLLSEKLGNDTTEAMFKYIDNKTERSVESTINTLATKDDVANLKGDIANLRKDTGNEFGILRKEVRNEFTNVRNEMANMRYDLSNKISDSIKWMFIFWIGQVGATLAIVFLFQKK
jgi:hypothetical protein